MQTINLTGEYALQCPELNNRIPLGYVDKSICGCGITTVALENNRNTIVLVPNTNLIKNKCSQYPNERVTYSILGVYGGITREEIYKYVKNTNLIKILVTYDSLYKIEHLLSRCDIIVDESDRLLANTKLKVTSKKGNNKDVISYLFDALEKYKDKVSFVSATPIPTEYMPKWVDELPKVKLEWEGVISTIPYIMSRGNPYKALIGEILIPLKERGEVVISDIIVTKVLVFINSITDIKKIIQKSGIKAEDVGYIVGDTVVNDVKLNLYSRVSDSKNLPKFTFVTSTGFQGIDLYDKEVISIVVSSTTKSFTMIDISTDLKQAISRQRDKDNIHYGKYIFIYDQNIFDEDEEVLLKKIENLKNKIKEGIQLYEVGKKNNLKEGIEFISEHKDFIAYTTYSEDKDEFELNKNAFNADKYFLLETRRQYEKGFKLRGLDNKVELAPVIIPREATFFELAKYFRKEIKEKKDLSKVEWGVYSTRIDWIDLIVTHYKLYSKVCTQFNKTKNMIDAACKLENQIKAEVQSYFKKGNKYARKEVKEYLNDIYKEYDIKRKASHRDMYTWFEVREKKMSGYDYVEIIDILK